MTQQLEIAGSVKTAPKSAKFSNLKGGRNGQSLQDLKFPGMQIPEMKIYQMSLTRSLFEKRGFKKEVFGDFVTKSLLAVCYGIESDGFKCIGTPWLCIPTEEENKAEQMKRTFAFQALMGSVKVSDKDIAAMMKQCYKGDDNEEFVVSTSQSSRELIEEFSSEADAVTFNGIQNLRYPDAVWNAMTRKGVRTKQKGNKEVEEEFLLSESLLERICYAAADRIVRKQRHEISVLGLFEQRGQLSEDYMSAARLALPAALYRDHLLGVDIENLESFYMKGDRKIDTWITDDAFRCAVNQLSRHWLASVRRLSNRQLTLADEDWSVRIAPNKMRGDIYKALGGAEGMELIFSAAKLDDRTQTAFTLSINGFSQTEISEVLYGTGSKQQEVSRLFTEGHRKIAEAAKLIGVVPGDFTGWEARRDPQVIQFAQMEWARARDEWRKVQKAKKKAEVVFGSATPYAHSERIGNGNGGLIVTTHGTVAKRATTTQFLGDFAEPKEIIGRLQPKQPKRTIDLDTRPLKEILRANQENALAKAQSLADWEWSNEDEAAAQAKDIFRRQIAACVSAMEWYCGQRNAEIQLRWDGFVEAEPIWDGTPYEEPKTTWESLDRKEQLRLEIVNAEIAKAYRG